MGGTQPFCILGVVFISLVFFFIIFRDLVRETTPSWRVGETEHSVDRRPGGSWRRMLPPGAIDRRCGDLCSKRRQFVASRDWRAPESLSLSLALLLRLFSSFLPRFARRSSQVKSVVIKLPLYDLVSHLFESL